jgi:hypothetical protein
LHPVHTIDENLRESWRAEKIHGVLQCRDYQFLLQLPPVGILLSENPKHSQISLDQIVSVLREAGLQPLMSNNRKSITCPDLQITIVDERVCIESKIQNLLFKVQKLILDSVF